MLALSGELAEQSGKLWLAIAGLFIVGVIIAAVVLRKKD